VEFYDRGGDFAQANGAAVDANMTPIGFAPFEKDWMVDFLLSLTDPRVRDESAPFDHPSLDVPDGAKGDASQVLNDGHGAAEDVFLHVNAVGAKGHPGKPLEPVLAGSQTSNAFHHSR
jgi:hypothetical protein